MGKYLSKLTKIALNTQFKRNMLSGSILHGLNILVVMISYPIYINYLGFELFSVWSLLSIVISFAKMGEFGISKAIVTYTANAKAINDFKEINRIFSSSVVLTIIPSILIASIIWLFSFQIVRALDVPIHFINESVLAVKFIGLAIGTYIFYDVLVGIITGIGRLDISNLLLFLLNLIKVLFTVFFLSLGMSLLGLVYATLSANLLFIIVAICLIIFRFKIPIYKWHLPRKKNLISLIKFGSSVIGMQVLNIFSTPFIKIILSRSVGIESVGVFELAFRAGYALRTFFEKGLFAIMPEIASLYGLKHTRKLVNKGILIKVKSLTTKLVIYILPLLILFLLLAPVWLKIWLNENYSSRILYNFWLLQPGILFGLIALPSYYALMGTRNELYCLYEAVLRTLLLILFSGIFLFANLKEVYIYIFFSLSVVLSNTYIVRIFIRKFI